ncbi:MAG: glycoside hydrolase family 92 protein [Bacteroidetes bacterium]|uniref:Glycoside hydrolase family 92 protein n=1 Tax=Candidatus Cryptobacteroides merdavium TaxID=2840769 RepID=A0A9D9EBH0_9BACT|nr:glycoside hydrolase family 92 protein [Candidatus Cryptobacteroides merdavium]
MEGYSRPVSIASSAKVTASKGSSGARYLTDGVIGVKNSGTWKSGTEDAWVKMTWDEPQHINKVVIFNSPSSGYCVERGELVFSDGSSEKVTMAEDGLATAVEFEERLTDFILFRVSGRNGKIAELSEMEVYPSPAQYTEAVEWVDPYIETDRGRFFFFITGQRPFGMVGAAPMTVNANNCGGGYAHYSKEVLGFPQIHAWTISGLNLMPTVGEVDPTKGEAEWKSPFRHDDEIVQPGYHRMYLSKSKVWVEQTATERVSFYRFKWTDDLDARLLLSLSGMLGNSRMTNASVRRTGANEFVGSISSVDRAYMVGPHDFKIYFVVQTDKDWDSFDGWNGDEMYRGMTDLRGDSAGVSLAYKVKAGDEVNMKIAISYTSIENAYNNLHSECSGWDFDAVREDTRRIWNEWLGKITVEGGTVEQKVKFYTDLWHVLLGRHRINDVNGDYPDRTVGREQIIWNQNGAIIDPVFRIKNTGRDKDGNIRHNMYNSDAFWLTQWNLNVLWGLAWPEILDDMAASLVEYSNNGGLIPRGPSGGGYSFIMTGCPGTSLIVSAYMKGLMTKTDPMNAFRQIKKNHFPGGMMGSKEELSFYIEHGWFPDNAGITIEASFQDWGAAQMAKKLGLEDDYRYFLKRSESWKNCFHPGYKLLFPIRRDGGFTHEDPLSPRGFVEANAWQATFGISHDIKGLSGLMGGNDVLCSMLDSAFRKEVENDFTHGYGNGHISYANQPGCSNAHVFSYAGAPWLTQYWVRQVKEQAYGGTTPELGYGGHDEDQGQMGGVSALMAIGLFNILGNESQTPFYEITAPIFDKITIKLDNRYYEGKEFTIKTYNNSSENCYIQKAKLNGAELDNFWFTHEQFAAGGLLEIWLGDTPNKEWGLSQYPPVDAE